MKFSHQLFAMLSLPVVCATAMAEGTLGAVEGMIPVDKLMPGRVVKAVLNPELKGPHEKVMAKFNALPEEKRKELASKITKVSAIDYIPELWDSKQQYDEYIKIWEANGVQELQQVVLGLTAGDKAGVWNVVSAEIDNSGKAKSPLLLSTLVYDANANTWTSNNGVMAAEAVSLDNKFVFGGQKGTEWKLEKEEAGCVMGERLQVTKTDDGKFVFVTYNFAEVSKATGKGIAQGGFVLRFPVQAAAGANIATPGQR